MSRNRLISNILDKDTNLVKNNKLDSDQITISARKIDNNTSGGARVYSNLASLPDSDSSSTGEQAFVISNNGLYIFNGSGWYKVATINITPEWVTQPNAEYVLNTDSTPTVITTDAIDSDGHIITFTATADSDFNQIATITKDSDNGRIFTVVPIDSENGTAQAGSGTVTFKASDGISFASQISTFSITFSTIVDNSAETVLLVKAFGNSLDNDAITYQNSSDVSTGFTETGNPQASTFSPYRSGGYSIYFDQDGDYLNPYTALDTFTGRYDNWTIEFWIYRTGNWTTGTPTPIGLSRMPDGYNVCLWGNDGNASYDTMWLQGSKYNCSDIIPDREWTFVSLTYDGTRQHVHYNGVRVLSQEWYFSSSYPLSTMTFGIGAEFDNPWNTTAGNFFGGYMTDIRLSDIARYTGASSTVPTEPLTDDANTVFLLSKDNGYLKDISGGANLRIAGNTHTEPFGPLDYSPWTADDVGGSVYFDGTNDYMEVSNSSDFAFGTGDFTVEAWVNYTTFSGSGGQAIVSNGTSISSATTGHWYLTAYGATDLRFGRHGSAQYTSVTSNLVVGAWNHIAVTRSGTTVRIFVNGVSLTTSDTAGGVGSYDFNNTSGILMIGEGASFSKASGYIADVRIIKGTAQYTSDFTPPAAPLSHTGSQTTLLMNNKSDVNMYDAAAANLLTLSGDTISSTTQRKFSTSSSVYLDGTGDYIDTDTSELFAFGTGDFTWESWIYHTVYEPAYLLEFGTGGDLGIHHATAQGHLTYYNSTTGIGSSLYTTGFGSMSVDTWYHIAAVRINGTTYLYTDGVLQTSATDSHNYGTAPLRLRIGAYGNGGTFPWTGYIQDLRITKGIGRYTAAFTPPTAEFEL